MIVAIVALVQAAPALAMSTAVSGFDLSAVLNARLLFYFAVFFALGYLLYSVLFAIVAVTCTSTEELGQSMMAAILPMVVALMVAISVISNPATTATRVLSLIPFFTPLVMTARVNVLMPPLWEVWLGIAAAGRDVDRERLGGGQDFPLRAVDDRQAADAAGADSRRQGVTAPVD